MGPRSCELLGAGHGVRTTIGLRKCGNLARSPSRFPRRGGRPLQRIAAHGAGISAAAICDRRCDKASLHSPCPAKPGRPREASWEYNCPTESEWDPQVHVGDSDEMRAEYNFSGGVRGKHVEAYRAGTNVVFLEPDLVAAFPDSASVNHALRLLVRLAQSKEVTGGQGEKPRRPTSRRRHQPKAKAQPRVSRG